MNPSVHPTIWSDPDFEMKGPEIKLAVLWALTNPETAGSVIGIFRFSKRRFANETGLEAVWLERMLDGDGMGRMFVRDGERVWIRNFIRYQFGVGEKLRKNTVAWAIYRRVVELGEKLQAAVFQQYPELMNLTPKRHGGGAIDSHHTRLGIASPPLAHLMGSGGGGDGVDQIRSDQSTEGVQGEMEKKETRERSVNVEVPAVEEVIGWGRMDGVSEEECRKFFHHYEGLGWMYGGTPIVNARAFLWKWRERAKSFRTGHQGSRSGTVADVAGMRAELATCQDKRRRAELRKLLEQA